MTVGSEGRSVADDGTAAEWNDVQSRLIRPKKKVVDLVVRMRAGVVDDALAVEGADERAHEDVARPVLTEVHPRVAGARSKCERERRNVPHRARRTIIRFRDDGRRDGE